MQFKVSARVYSGYGGPAKECSVTVWALDEAHAREVGDYAIAAANVGRRVVYIEILLVEAVEGEDVRMRRLDAPQLPLYEV